MCDDIQAEGTLYLTPEQVERLTESSFKHHASTRSIGRMPSCLASS